LEKAAEELSQHIPEDRRPPSAMVSAHIWAMSHGVVELFARGNPGANTPFPPEDLLEAGIGTYLRGLGLIPPE
ncbi:MAG: TetR/AcrR family transcriptional regulator, partial [Pseudomonadota bacterium]